MQNYGGASVRSEQDVSIGAIRSFEILGPELKSDDSFMMRSVMVITLMVCVLEWRVKI